MVLRQYNSSNLIEDGIKLVVAHTRTITVSVLARVHKIANCVEPYLQCGICYDMMKHVAVVDRGHMFCIQCIVRWLKSRESAPCPLCVSSVT